MRLKEVAGFNLDVVLGRFHQKSPKYPLAAGHQTWLGVAYWWLIGVDSPFEMFDRLSIALHSIPDLRQLGADQVPQQRQIHHAGGEKHQLGGAQAGG